MLGFSIPSTGIILMTVGFEVDTRTARAFAEVFSPLGILVSSKCSNWRTTFCKTAR